MRAANGHFFKRHWVMVLILLVAGFFRFYGLPQRGLIESDSCFYANLSKTPLYALNFFQNGGSVSDSKGLLAYLKGNGCVFNSEKPGHTLLIFISFLIFGIKDWAVLSVSALCGVISLLGVYVIAIRFFTKEAGIIAAALMAFSGLMVAFSRTGYPQMGTMLMVVTVLYFYFRYHRERQTKHLYLSAVTIGVALLFHPTFLIVLIPILVHFFFDTILINREKSPKLAAVMVSGVLIVLPVLLEEGVFAVANRFSTEHEISGVYQHLFHVSGKLTASNQSADFSSGFRFFFEMMRMTDGLPWTLFFIGACLFGTFKGVREKNPFLCILAGQVILSLALWSWKYPTVKVLPVCYPALCLLAGTAVWQIVSMGHLGKAGLAVSIALVGLSANYPFLKGQLTLSPQYRQAVLKTKEIVDRDGGIFRAEDQGSLRPMLNFYMPQINSSRMGNVFEGSQNETVHYEMLDFGRMVTDPRYSENLLKHCPMVLDLENYDHLMPVTHYHRLKNEGLEYIQHNFNKKWLNVYLFRRCAHF